VFWPVWLINPQENHINILVVVRLCYGTHNHVDDGVYRAQLCGAGVVCSGEVLSVVHICGNDRQSGVLGRRVERKGKHYGLSKYICMRKKICFLQKASLYVQVLCGETFGHRHKLLCIAAYYWCPLTQEKDLIYC